MMGNTGIPSPHPHPTMMQQQPPIGGPPGQNPIPRYMMNPSAQVSGFRAQMPPMNMMSERYLFIDFCII